MAAWRGTGMPMFCTNWGRIPAEQVELEREIYDKLLACLDSESYFHGAREYVMKRRGRVQDDHFATR